MLISDIRYIIMGNALLDQSRTDPKEIYQQWLEQNPDLIGRKILAHNKLFETNFFKYCEFSIKMSVFLRRDNTNIQDYLKAFQIIQSLVERHKCIHILPMRILEMKQFRDREFQKYTQNFTIGMRQYVHMTLQQKIQGRPTLTQAEKIWLIYQMIFAMFTCHDIFNIYHGNIRSSNFLVNRYQYLYLTDFASYKPVYIMQNTEQGLAQFRLFYSSSDEKCYLAPEKLVENESSNVLPISSKSLFNFNVKQMNEKSISAVSTGVSQPKKLKRNISFEEGEGSRCMTTLKQMDMFSLGLTILEVLNDGRSSMSYSELLKKRKEGMDFEQLIKDSVNKLTCKSSVLEQILTSLLRVIPQDRMDATKCLQKVCRVIDQQMYHLLWMCLSAFSRSSFSSCDLRVKLFYALIDFIQNEIRKSGYKWINQPPRCLEGFNALKIFVELIQKHSIFSPKIEGGGEIISKLLGHFEKEDIKKQGSVIPQQIIAEQIDQRRKFFINTAKQSQIAKRFSIAVQIHPESKRLCPPSIRQIEHLFEGQHQPIKLTKIGLRPPRQDVLMQEYRETQYIRQEKKKRKKYYKTSQIMIKVIFGCIRGCKYVASKLVALELMNLLGKDCGDEFRLHVLLPYFINLSEDIDLSVCRQAFFSFISLFYDFVDPFRKEEDIYYYEIILEYIVNIIRQSKNHKLRPTLFANFKEIFSILEWLQVHYKKFNKQLKFTILRLVQILRVNYGYFTKDEVKLLLNGNIPDHLLAEVFEYYISLLNTDRLQGLKLSLKFANNINPLQPGGRGILNTFDNGVEGGLDQHGMSLVYAIQYFTLRKIATISIIKKIAPHVINPSKWVRDSTLNYIKMCLNEYPPTKNFFFFKDIFAAPFPLKPEDINQEVLLPECLKESEIDWYDKKLKTKDNSLTINLFGDYLSKVKQGKGDKDKKRVNEQVQRWNETRKAVQEAAEEGKVFDFESYIRRQLDLLYEFNLLFYVLNLSNRFVPVQKQKERQVDKSNQIVMAFRKAGWSIDYNSVDYEKKQIFQRLQAFVNSSFEKHLYKRNKDYGEPVSDKIKIAEAIITIGEVLTKFQMFKIRPIPKLGTYIRQPIVFQKLARPKGVLISQIFEHTDTVTCIQKVADQFILSGSADGSLRMFDAKKIQANVTMCSEGWLDMRGQGQEKAKVAAVASFDQTYAAVVGSNRGHIRVYPIERFQKGPNANRNDEIVKYAVGGQLQKIATLTNQMKNECFCYITAEGNLGVQDIRVKSRTISCSIGRERGIPRALCPTSRQSILVGTVDGYVMNFDIRFNVISSVFQLHSQRETIPITNIVTVPNVNADASDSLFAITYPSKHYQFCCFNLMDNRAQFGPQRQYISSSSEEIVSTPYFVNRTSDEQFKLCRNSLIWRKQYEELRDFSKNFSIFDYLSDPLTRRQARIRQIWLDNSKNRYNQISSLYNKKNLPFLEFLHSGILTSCNPLPGAGQELKQRPSFALLMQRKQLMREQSDLQRTLVHRPNHSHKVFGFGGEQTRQYFTCCRVLPNLVVAGCRNSTIKIYS